MHYTPIIVGMAAAAILLIWLFSVSRTLALLDDSVNNAMNQFGVQLSGQWDVVSAMLDLVKEYAENEYKSLCETMKARKPITVESSVKDAAEQDNLLVSATSRILAAAQQHPLLMADKGYQKTIDRVILYEGKVLQSRLVYNDGVTKLNRRIRMFPTKLVAGKLGFSKRDYLERQKG